jgi:hypothetical protein
MTQSSRALVLASAMIGIALLAVFEVVPAEAAQFAPIGLMVFIPWVLGDHSCRVARKG